MRDRDAQMMVMAAVLIAMAMAALAFVNYSSMVASEGPVHAGTDDSVQVYESLKRAYTQAVRQAYLEGSNNPGPRLENHRKNITRWGERHGYSVVLLPDSGSKGYDADSFNGSIVVTDGTTTFRSEVNVDLTG